MREVLLLLSLVALGLPAVSFAGPNEAFAEVVGHEVPKNLLSRARPLRFFEHASLVTYVHMDPTAGPPGLVLEDVRMAWSERDQTAQRIDLAWMVSYRAAHPLDVTTLSDEDLTAYLAELVLMIPGAHRWGFKVVSMERRQRRIRLRFKTPHDMAIGEMVLEQSVRFDLNGAVESWSHLQRKWVSERP